VRLAYIVLAHRLPAQVGRLVDRLDAEATSFFVHVDRNAGEAPYREVAARLGGRPNVHLLPRVACAWGTWSLVAATLGGLRRVLQSGAAPDYVVLLSGQDYPLRSPAQIAAFFAARRGAAFIRASPLPDFGWFPDGGAHRFRGLAPPAGLALFGGSQWWALPADCAAYVAGVADGDRALVRFFAGAKFPDEHFVQTVVMNSPCRDRVAPDLLWYTDWDWAPDASHPKVLGVEDAARLLGSAALFARKFDPAQDAAILDLVDAHVATAS
jgi:hypothetical protein